MAPRVLERARHSALVTLEAAKSHLGISGATEDALVAVLLEHVRGLFEGELGRPLVRQRYAETLPTTSRRRVVLSVYPVDAHSVTATLAGETVDGIVAIEPARGVLYLEAGWGGGSGGPEDAAPDLEVTYRAGWLSPDAIQTWAAGLTLAAGEWLRPSSPALCPWLLEVTTGGATGAGPEPVWPSTAGEAVAVGAAVAAARDAVEVPAGVQALALYTLGLLYNARKREPGMVSLSADGFSATWAPGAVLAGGLPEEVRAALRPWRWEG